MSRWADALMVARAMGQVISYVSCRSSVVSVASRPVSALEIPKVHKKINQDTSETSTDNSLRKDLPKKTISMQKPTTEPQKSLENPTESPRETMRNLPKHAQNLTASRVPTTRIGRLFQYGALAAGVSAGIAGEAFKRAIGQSQASGEISLSESRSQVMRVFILFWLFIRNKLTHVPVQHCSYRQEIVKNERCCTQVGTNAQHSR